ncbi:MAG: copper chaperone PCu(A)C [Pseudomonadota bacterium]
MTRFFLASATALLMVACSDTASNPTENVSETVVQSAPASASVTLTDAYLFPPLQGRDVGAGFFIATNNGDLDRRLVSASSPVADTIELHTHTMTDGVMAMREVEGIDIPAGESVVLRPGGFHLMMFGMALEEGQVDAPVTLTYANGETQTLSLPVRAR